MPLVNPSLRKYQIKGVQAVSNADVSITLPNDVLASDKAFISNFRVRCKTAVDSYAVGDFMRNYGVSLNNGSFDTTVPLMPIINTKLNKLVIPSFRLFYNQLGTGFSYNQSDPSKWVYDIEILY